MISMDLFSFICLLIAALIHFRVVLAYLGTVFSLFIPVHFLFEGVSVGTSSAQNHTKYLLSLWLQFPQ